MSTTIFFLHVRLFPIYAVRFRASDMYFSISKTDEPAYYAVEIYMQNQTGIFSIWEIDDPSRRILARNPTTWVIRFLNRKMACSLNSRCYPWRQQTAAERSMSWKVTQLYSGVASSRTLGRRAARPFVARRQSPGAGSDLETKISALGRHLSVDTYEYLYVDCCPAEQQQQSVTTWNPKYQNRWL